MEKKLIFLDIDGTLTVPGSNTPPDSALAAIRAAQAKGHRVFLCTGRNRGMLAPLLKFGFDGFIASAGGYIECGSQVIYDHPMEDPLRKLTIDTFHQNGIFCTLEARDATYADANLRDFLPAAKSDTSEIERWRVALARKNQVLPMEDYTGQPIYKIVFMAPEDQNLAAARQVLDPYFLFCFERVFSPKCLNGEIINREFDKGQGLLRVCRHLGMDAADTLGFGDSANDRQMLELAGTSVCMGNGSPAMQQISDYVCPPVDRDGLFTAFQTLNLI